MLERVLTLLGLKSSPYWLSKDPILRNFAQRSAIPFYKKLTAEIIAATKDEEVDRLVTFNLSAIIEKNKSIRDVSLDKTLTDCQKAFYITREVEIQVRNGGFNQFFYNNYGRQLVNETVISFQQINAPAFAVLMGPALTLYRQVEQRLQKYRDGTLESFAKSYEGGEFAELDNQFNTLNHRESFESELEIIRTAYVRNNIKEFTKSSWR